MPKIIGGILAGLGYFFAAVVVYNIYFAETPLFRQFVIGGLGILLVIGYMAYMREYPLIQKVVAGLIMALGALMFIPIAWIVFFGGDPTPLRIVVAILGVILFFIGWRSF